MHYWKTDLSDAPLAFAPAADVLTFIKRGIYEGEAVPLSSRSFLDSVAARIVSAPHDLFVFVARHPYLTFIAMVGLWAGAWWILRWCARPGPSSVPINAKAD